MNSLSLGLERFIDVAMLSLALSGMASAREPMVSSKSRSGVFLRSALTR